MTSTVDVNEDMRGRPIQKAKVCVCTCVGIFILVGHWEINYVVSVGVSVNGGYSV